MQLVPFNYTYTRGNGIMNIGIWRGGINNKRNSYYYFVFNIFYGISGYTILKYSSKYSGLKCTINDKNNLV